MHALAQFAVVFVVSSLSLAARADLGPLDPTFGGDGIVEPDACNGVPTCLYHVQRVQPVPGGRLLELGLEGEFLGSFSSPPTGAIGMRLMRRLPDGTPDASFGTGGVVSLFGRSGGVFPRRDGALTMQPDGKILVAAGLIGSCSSVGCVEQLGVARLLPDGTLDSSFSGGTVAHPSGNYAITIAVQQDGGILVATGRASGPYRVIRFTASGAVDASYGIDGVATFAFPNDGNPFTNAGVAFRADGTAIAAISTNYGIQMASLDGAGQPRAAFNGPLGYREFTAMVRVTSLVLQGDKALLGGGSSDVGSLLLRVRDDGSPDTAFGPGGVRSYVDASSIQFLAIDAQGRIVGAGGEWGGHLTLRRWNAEGADDSLLNGSGKLVLAAQSSPKGLALLPNSKAVIPFFSNDNWRLDFVARAGANALQDNREFVLQQYRDFLVREGDASGVLYWTGRVSSGATLRAELVAMFLRSPEFETIVAPVARLYLAYFTRIPDSAGLAHWTAQHRAGTALPAISESFAGSTEFATTYGALDNGAFVDRVYRNVLARAPDTAGYDYWLGRLDRAELTRGELMLLFSEGAEFRALVANEVQVIATYQGMLQRAPETAGYDFWVGYLDAGNTVNAMVDGFMASTEYRERFAP